MPDIVFWSALDLLAIYKTPSSQFRTDLPGGCQTAHYTGLVSPALTLLGLFAGLFHELLMTGQLFAQGLQPFA